MRYFFLFFLTFFSASSVAANLVTLYQQALQRNNAYHAKLLETTIKAADRDQASAVFFPQISVSASEGYSKTRTELDTPFDLLPNLDIVFHDNTNVENVNLELRQLLFDWQAIMRYVAEKKLTSAEKLLEDSTRETLLFEVAKNYFQVLDEHDQLEYLIEQKHFYAHQLKMAKARRDQLRATRLAVDQAQTSLAYTNSKVIAARNSLHEAVQTLENKVGVPVLSILQLEKSLPVHNPTPVNLATWQRLALSNNVQLKAARLKLNAAEDEIKLYEGANYPKAFLEAGISDQHYSVPVFKSVHERSSEFLFGVKMNLFSGGLDAAKIRKAALQYEQAQLRYAQAVSDLKTATNKVFYDIIALNNKILSDREALTTAETARKAALNAYSIGVSNMTDVLDQEKTVLRVKVQNSKDLYDYLLLELKLEELTGDLTLSYLKKINGFLSEEHPLNLTQLD